jgi:hypothetical protein
VAEVSARALRVEQLTSALVPHTPSFGSIFINSFLRGPFVKIVSTKGHFQKILYHHRKVNSYAQSLLAPVIAGFSLKSCYVDGQSKNVSVCDYLSALDRGRQQDFTIPMSTHVLLRECKKLSNSSPPIYETLHMPNVLHLHLLHILGEINKCENVVII